MIDAASEWGWAAVGARIGVGPRRRVDVQTQRRRPGELVAQLRRWLEATHCPVGPVRVKVPVSLHGAKEGHVVEDQGNRDSYFCLDLPLGPFFFDENSSEPA